MFIPLWILFICIAFLLVFFGFDLIAVILATIMLIGEFILLALIYLIAFIIGVGVFLWNFGRKSYNYFIGQ